MNMKSHLICIMFICSCSVWAVLPASTIKLQFSDRVKMAEDLESRDATKEYFKNQFYPGLVQELAGVLKKCTSIKKANLEDMTVGAEVSLTVLDYTKATIGAIYFQRLKKYAKVFVKSTMS